MCVEGPPKASAGERKNYLGQTTATPDLYGNASVSFRYFVGDYAASETDVITATATKNSTGDTSEFS